MKSTILVIMFSIFLYSLTFAQDFEDFESGDFSNYFWSLEGDANWLISPYEPYEGVFCAQSGEIDDFESSDLSITLETAANGVVSFFWKASSQADSDYLKFYIDGTLQDTLSGERDWTFSSIDVNAGIHTFQWSFSKDHEISELLDTGWIDNISFPQLANDENDLAALSISGPQLVYTGDSGVFDVEVKNFGSSAQSNYTVLLNKQDGTVLESRTIEDELLPGEERIHRMVWLIPEDEVLETAHLWGEVQLDGDEHETNNWTSLIAAYVLQGDLIEIRIGYGIERNNWSPFNFHFRNNISESLYYPSDIQYNGSIVAIGYFNDFQSNILNRGIQIWMGMTTTQNLLNGWVNFGSLTEVFNGTADFPAGMNRIIIPLDPPFVYNSSNLAVRTYGQYDTEIFTLFEEFMSTHDTPYPYRTRAINDNSQLNPESPTNGYVFNRIPNTSFFMLVEGLGSVNGYVYDVISEIIVEADITIEGSNKKTVSNGAGYYLLGNMLQDEYSFTASKYGYLPQTIVESVIGDETIDLDFTLTSLGTVTISGRIVRSDFPEIGIAGANIALEGYGEYTAVSDENGDFEIHNVYIDNNYELSIYTYGFETHFQQVSVAESSIDLGTIILQEIAYPPRNLSAIQNEEGTEVLLNWEAPVFFREFETFNVYRFQEDEFFYPENWEILSAAQSDTFFIDTDWTDLMEDFYQYSVTSIYTNDIESEPIFSEILEKMTHSEDNTIISKTRLSGNFPNPFNPSTTISFSLAKDAKSAEINIYNIKGQRIRSFPNLQRSSSPNQQILWDGKDQTGIDAVSGIYFYNLKTNSFSTTKKMILIR
ncbi:MAG: carboxypeptidase regulatory-like domain-containing protein [Candidatus Cloacimonetes bacterium]|nr:carboxypeptidase regulatory-like domain-containing protein [Candidatus Cloacimonadota bacterium]